MKQFNLVYDSEENFRKKLGEIKQWCDANASGTVIFRIYSQDMEREHISRVCRILDDEMPKALYFGCSSNANILDGVLTDARIIVTCTIFEYKTTQAIMLQHPFSEENYQAAVSDLMQYCERNPWVKSVEMLATIMDMSMKGFCDEMTKLPEHIQVFGGGAFNPNMDDETAYVFSKGNDFLPHGIVFLLLGGEDLHTYSTFISGWKPLKRRFTVTKADKEVLYELDGMPAFGVYHRFLKIKKNDKFFSNTLEFPLFMEHDGIDILRCPLAVNEDDSLVMSSDMEENATVRLAYGDPETILRSIRKDGQKIANFQPEVIQTFSCAARRAFWGDENISKETELFKEVAPTAGFYTHGEFIRIGTDMLNFNVTLVIAAMREGVPAEEKKINFYDASRDNLDKIPMIMRFVSFIEASTTDLEEMNMRLALTAITDGLTQLYNRAETERRIRVILDDIEAGEGNGNASVIMLDIDNFKKVNDIYGHKEGDRVIIGLADVLREVTVDNSDFYTGRWGGEEFMVLLDGCELSQAFEIAEKIRVSFHKIKFSAAGHQTVSVGVAQVRKGESVDVLYNRVDKALYTAKANGKNRVISEKDLEE